MWSCIDYNANSDLVRLPENTPITDVAKFADAHATYTRKDITVRHYTSAPGCGNHITGTRKWHDGVEYKKEFQEKNPIEFGKLGYYSDWHYTITFSKGGLAWND